VSFFVRSGAINGLPQLLDEFDVELVPLLQSFGLPLDLCQDDDSLIEIAAVDALLEKAAELCHCPHFGLLLGSRQQPSYYMGMVGLIMQSSPDLETAHNEYVRYGNLVAQGLNWSIETEGDYTTLRLTFEKDVPPISTQAIGLTITHASNVWRLLSNNQWKPQEVCFHYDPPPETWFHRQLFGSNIRFNAEFDGFLFSSDYLKLPVHSKNDYLRETLSRYAAEENQDAAREFTAQVKQIIRQLLPSGSASMENVARYFNCDKRTLQRRLKRKDLTFQILLDGERFNLACRHLKNSSIPLTTVALVVGFADISTFSRAFKHQFGVSPSEWRRHHSTS
jgi:AraC-like DNA-binding protein